MPNYPQSNDDFASPPTVPPGSPATPVDGKKSNNKILIGVLIGVGGLIALGCLGCGVLAVVAADDDDESSSSSSPDSSDEADDEEADAETEADDAESVAEVGDEVQDGTFSFVVNDTEAGVSEVGGDFLSEEAQGEFIIVDVTVENTGDSAEYFSDSGQQLVDDEGKEYDADSEAGIYIEDNESLLEKINPGNKIDVKLVFDVPEGVEPTTLVLSESVLSDGVEVSLSY